MRVSMCTCVRVCIRVCVCVCAYVSKYVSARVCLCSECVCAPPNTIQMTSRVYKKYSWG